MPSPNVFYGPLKDGAERPPESDTDTEVEDAPKKFRRLRQDRHARAKTPPNGDNPGSSPSGSSRALGGALSTVDISSRAGQRELVSRASSGDLAYVGTGLQLGWVPTAEAVVGAARGGQIEVLGMLLAFVPSGVHFEGVTPLAAAIAGGSLEAVKLLLEQPQNFAWRSQRGQSYRELAASSTPEIKEAIAKVYKERRERRERRESREKRPPKKDKDKEPKRDKEAPKEPKEPKEPPKFEKMPAARPEPSLLKRRESRPEAAKTEAKAEATAKAKAAPTAKAELEKAAPKKFSLSDYKNLRFKKPKKEAEERAEAERVEKERVERERAERERAERERAERERAEQEERERQERELEAERERQRRAELEAERERERQAEAERQRERQRQAELNAARERERELNAKRASAELTAAREAAAAKAEAELRFKKAREEAEAKAVAARRLKKKEFAVPRGAPEEAEGAKEGEGDASDVDMDATITLSAQEIEEQAREIRAGSSASASTPGAPPAASAPAPAPTARDQVPAHILRSEQAVESPSSIDSPIDSPRPSAPPSASVSGPPSRPPSVPPGPPGPTPADLERERKRRNREAQMLQRLEQQQQQKQQNQRTTPSPTIGGAATTTEAPPADISALPAVLRRLAQTGQPQDVGPLYAVRAAGSAPYSADPSKWNVLDIQVGAAYGLNVHANYPDWHKTLLSASEKEAMWEFCRDWTGDFEHEKRLFCQFGMCWLKASEVAEQLGELRIIPVALGKQAASVGDPTFAELAATLPIPLAQRIAHRQQLWAWD